MYPRKIIVPEKSVCHVFFRTHNRSNFLEPKEIKKYLLVSWAKQKKKHHVRIFEFCIMDNHVHLAVGVKNAHELANFMRTTNSALARKINKYFERDSQAIRERYKSPVVTSVTYARKLLPYIWLNRYKVNKNANPQYDQFNSYSWRQDLKIIDTLGFDNETKDLLNDLLDHDERIHGIESKIKDFCKGTLSQAAQRLNSLDKTIFENTHTIGDAQAVAFRKELVAAFRNHHPPPNLRALEYSIP